MNERDFDTLFSYFIGARGNHAVHVRALIHAGFEVEPESPNSWKSYVINPISRKKIGVILGEPDAIIGKYTPIPEPPHPPTTP